MRAIHRVAAGAGAAFAIAAACVAPEDVPSNVHDLRVLGVRLDPPELMAPSCDTQDPAAMLPAYAQPVTYTALIADPAGQGRPLEVELSTCAGVDGGVCDSPEARHVLVPEQEVSPGESTFELGLVAFTGAPDEPVLFEALAQDSFGGLGGVRLPLVLTVSAGEEGVAALKRMLFSCRFFPEMEANVNPELPGVLLEGQEWAEGAVPTLEGARPFAMEPVAFDELQEAYLVPTFDLQPLRLEERWEIAWHADYGTFAPYQTGGADFGGVDERHQVEWTPPPDATERDVRFWMVARDGRGGSSWITRTAHFRP